METSLTKTGHQLPAITSKLSDDEKYFIGLDGTYTIKQYATLKISDPNSGFKGEDLARYYIGNALQMMYQMIGVPIKNYPEPELAKRIAKYIQRTFDYITPKEIIDSVEFALQGKFPINRKDGTTLLDHFRNVDLKFISEFLQAYVKWRYDKKRSVEKKIEASTPYHVITELLQREDKSVKEFIRDRFEKFHAAAEQPEKRACLAMIRDIQFDWMVQIGLIVYDPAELNEKFKSLRQLGISSSEAKHQVRIFAMVQAFDKLKEEKDPFEIFNRVTYVSWNVLETLYATTGKKLKQ